MKRKPFFLNASERRASSSSFFHVPPNLLACSLCPPFFRVHYFYGGTFCSSCFSRHARLMTSVALIERTNELVVSVHGSRRRLRASFFCYRRSVFFPSLTPFFFSPLFSPTAPRLGFLIKRLPSLFFFRTNNQQQEKKRRNVALTLCVFL